MPARCGNCMSVDLKWTIDHNDREILVCQECGTIFMLKSRVSGTTQCTEV